MLYSGSRLRLWDASIWCLSCYHVDVIVSVLIFFFKPLAELHQIKNCIWMWSLELNIIVCVRVTCGGQTHWILQTFLSEHRYTQHEQQTRKWWDYLACLSVVVPADGLERLVTETGKNLSNDDSDLILSLSMSRGNMCDWSLLMIGVYKKRI